MKDVAMLNGDKIRKWMISSRISTEKLAVLLQVSPSLIRQMIGGYIPRRGGEVLVASLAKKMRVETASLFVGQR